MKDKFILIGTAGHVDHGKTELIHALTGISTDRLKEEKERGISIELGFAHLILPDGRKAGIVDVPGHEKFVRQMLAGASGMDLVLLVIAADEGVMPQTREHLDILNLLQINKGVIVLTKIDLVDQEWLSMIEEDTREQLKGTILENSPFCQVSSVSGTGIPQLLQTINRVVAQTESKRLDLPARLPVDRVFTVQGFGTVVTGTLNSGILKKGQEVRLEPGAHKVKIRNIQIYGDQKEQAQAGQRVAINLGGIAVSEIQRGTSLIDSSDYTAGQIVDAELTNLPGEKRAILQRQRIRFHVGTAEAIGRIHLLEKEELAPGEKAFAQIILEEPILAIPGDRFVIRFYSPITTIGGGTVLGLASHKKKRFKDKVLEELRLKAEGCSGKLIEKELSRPLSVLELSKLTGLEMEIINQELSELQKEKLVSILKEDDVNLYWLNTAAEKWGQNVTEEITRYQKAYPLRNGMGREELRKKAGLNLSLKRWQEVLEWGAQKKYFCLAGNNVQTFSEISLPEQLQKELDCLRKLWQKEGLSPPDLENAASCCGISPNKIIEYAGYLAAKNKWHRIGEYYFTTEAIKQAADSLTEYLHSNQQITVAEARDLWNTTRKYALPLLEYFDSIRLTRREGLVRHLNVQ